MCDTSSNRAERPRRRLEAEGQDGGVGDAATYGLDEYFMDRAIDIAWLGAGKTAPNPLVGSVVVKEGRVLGVGYHPRYGEEHAETIALDRAGEAARGATLYVTLEPCTHQGNTPPCVDHVIRSGVGRVVVCTSDPDERVNGRGIRMLRDRGLRVSVGCRAERAMLLNMAYFKSKLGLTPAVTLKMAVSLDGKIASRPGKRDEITGRESRKMVHRLRALHDAVMVGIDTVLTDSPRLDCRLLDCVRPPVPVVLDSELRFPPSHPWTAERRPVIVTAPDASAEREQALIDSGARVVRCRLAGDGIDVGEALSALDALGVSSLLVEGGGRVFSSFLAAGAWDGMFIFMSPVLFGPDGVGAADREFRRQSLGAVPAGVSVQAGDVLLGFIGARAHRILEERLL